MAEKSWTNEPLAKLPEQKHKISPDIFAWLLV